MKRINGASASVRDTEKRAFIRQSVTVGNSSGKKDFSRAASKGRKSTWNIARSKPLTVS
jgi:hypothetical protein